MSEIALDEKEPHPFDFGVLLYAGRDVLPLGDRRTLAVPLSELWER